MTFASQSTALRATLAIAAILLGLSGAARADEIADIGKLLRAGQLEQASQRVDAYLSSRPRDAQGQFLKGLILTEQNKSAEAIAVFTRLTELYPELPEPYNNLAVLFAGQGQFERARQALEMAIRTHPSYATAHENLGDVYAKLASQAYDKALQLDSNNSAAQTKLALVRDLIGGARPRAPVVAQAGSKPASTPAAPAAPPATAQKPAAPAVAAAPAPAPQAGASAPGKPPAAPVTAPPAATPAAPAPPPAPAAPAAPAKPASDDAEVRAAVNAWASAWGKKDVNAYLATYARDFKLPAGESRQAWESGRKQRIEAPKRIEVRIEDMAISYPESGVAVVKFRQNYKSNIVTARSSKTLVLAKAGGKWQIREERSGN